MIYEKIDLRINIKQLREQLNKDIFVLDPMMQTKAFGGWSILSSDGDYKDGWQKGYELFEMNHYKNLTEQEKIARIGFSEQTRFLTPTSLCTGYLKEIVQKISDLNLQPSRVRISVLKANSESAWHTDAPPEQRAVRLHVPIITNEHCKFVCEEGQAHLAADGHGYLLKVNHPHKIINESDEDRYHLIMDVKAPDSFLLCSRPQHSFNAVNMTELKFDYRMIIKCLIPIVEQCSFFAETNQISLRYRSIIENQADIEKFKDGIGILNSYSASDGSAKEEDFDSNHPAIRLSYLEDVIAEIRRKQFPNIGRLRLMRLAPKTCYSWHKDSTKERLHIPVVTNDSCFYVTEQGGAERMQEVGRLYTVNTEIYHTAINASFKERLHLVFSLC